MTIRRAGPADAARLALVGRATFLENFAHDHQGDDLMAYLAVEQSEDWYRSALTRDGWVFWIAEAALGAPVGYAILKPGEEPDAFELKRIYLLWPWRGNGNGRALFDHAHAECVARGGRELRLTVYRENARALAFYRRIGFEQVGTIPFMVGESAYEDLVMALPTGAGRHSS